jgi:serine phosphatase RsbU (regulator of sigma subunit)
VNDEKKKLEIENIRLKSAVKELVVLNEISSVINSTMTVEEISQRIMNKVVSAIHVGEAAVHTFSEGGDQLSPHTFVRGKSNSSMMVKAKLDIRIAGWIARHKKPLVINDIRSDERFRGVDFTDNPISSLLAVPLSAKGKLIGALTVFNSREPEGFADDDIRLLGIIGVQSAQIIENARLYQEELRLRQLEGEVQAAQKIQEGFLPRDIPGIEGFDVFGGSLAAKETGGDYFDFIPTPNDRLYFTLGDVSGKGLPAALLMSTIQGQTRLLVNRNPDMKPREILHELNQNTCQLSSSTQFATMVVGQLDPGDSRIVLSNGGHNYPLVARCDGSLEEMMESSVLIGMFDQANFMDTACHLEAGDLVAIASDGIEEAFNEEDAVFGMERFKELLIEYRGFSAPEIYERVLNAVAEFRGAAEQSDDITLTIIKRHTGSE